jgi:hypothetical protein
MRQTLKIDISEYNFDLSKVIKLTPWGHQQVQRWAERMIIFGQLKEYVNMPGERMAIDHLLTGVFQMLQSTRPMFDVEVFYPKAEDTFRPIYATEWDDDNVLFAECAKEYNMCIIPKSEL